MEPEQTDQEAFDNDVKRVGRTILQVSAGVGIFAALIMSVLALTLKTSGTTGAPAVASPARPAAAMTANVVIAHVLRGCHALGVNGSPATSPDATIHLGPGGTLSMQNNDVMPHRLVLLHGGQAPISGATMNRMGATSSVAFPTAGTYTFTTKTGADYTAGVTTLGPDNTLKLVVIVGPAASAA